MKISKSFFEQFGLKGDSKLVLREKNYEAIQFGEDFKSLCDYLKLDEADEKKVRRYILDYAFYEVYREYCTFIDKNIEEFIMALVIVIVIIYEWIGG